MSRLCWEQHTVTREGWNHLPIVPWLGTPVAALRMRRERVGPIWASPLPCQASGMTDGNLFIGRLKDSNCWIELDDPKLSGWISLYRSFKSDWRWIYLLHSAILDNTSRNKMSSWEWFLTNKQQSSSRNTFHLIVSTLHWCTQLKVHFPLKWHTSRTLNQGFYMTWTNANLLLLPLQLF